MSRLEKVDGALWLAEGGVVSFYGFPYPTRTAIARLADARLWVWSPIGLDSELRLEVDRLGRVAHLVSPNKLHHLYLAEWRSAYPWAQLWGPESTVRRRRDLAFAEPLKDSSPAEWGPDFDQAWFRGSSAMDELVFFHRPSRTALIADLVQAFDDRFLQENWSWWRRPLARLDGIAAANPGAPREWRLSFTNRAAARAARDKVLSWNCERAIIAHGEWRRSGGQEFLRRALTWLGP
ncbi:MAG TPA: DUF4336 domain-containing protein [Roseiarcus sp.]|nr:DUF4336 domain-containing protein [Roseiarcus sp.]